MIRRTTSRAVRRPSICSSTRTTATTAARRQSDSSGIGVKLSETEARLFAFACRQGGASLTDAKAVTGQAGPGARKVLSALAVQGLLEPLGDADRYGLAWHLKDSHDAAQVGQSTSDQGHEGVERLVSDQPGRPDTNLVTPLLTNLSDDQRKIIALCEAPQKQAHLMRETGLSHRTFFRRKRSEPLIQSRADPHDASERAEPPGPVVRGERGRNPAPERMANRRRPRPRSMSRGWTMPRLVTHRVGLVTDQPVAPGTAWSLPLVTWSPYRSPPGGTHG